MTISVAIDIQGAQGASRHRGIGRYVHMLTKSLLELEQDEIRYQPVASPNAPLPSDLVKVSEKTCMEALDFPPRSILLKHSRYLDGFYNKLDVAFDSVLVGSPFEGYRSMETTSPTGTVTWANTTIPVVYDLIPLRFPQLYFADNPDYENWYFTKLDTLIKAKHLLAISEATRQDLIDLLCIPPEKISVIGAGVPASFNTNAVPSHHVREKYKDLGSYFITVYQEDHRKNPELLLRAFASLPFDIRMTSKIVVVTSHDRHSEKLKEKAYSIGIPEDALVVTGYVSDDELTYLYSNAVAMVFPSIYEGFGLPALEAILVGTLALVSNQSSLPEVAGTSDTLFNPYDENDLKALLIRSHRDRLWNKERWRTQFEHAQRFSWKEISQRAHKALLETNERYERDSSTASKTLYVTSPVPPIKSGIATYLTGWTRALSQHSEIVVVSDDATKDITDKYISQHSMSKDRFEALQLSVASFVHHLGNQPYYHSYQLELLERYGGVVVLHDVILDHFSDFIEHLDLPIPASLKNLFGVIPKPKADMDLAYIAELRSLRIRALLRWVWERADGIVVHSQYAKDLLLNLGEIQGDKVHVSVQGQALKCHVQNPPAKDLHTPDKLTITLPGFIDLSKSPSTVLRAVSLLPLKLQPKITFLGSGDPAIIGSLTASAKTLDIELDITGYLDDRAFHDRLSQSQIGLVLRSHDRGETSAAAILCLSLGVPLIVEAKGSFAEFPDTICVKVAKLDPQSLADAISTLTLDPGLRADLAHNARIFVEQELNWNKVSTDVLALLRPLP